MEATLSTADWCFIHRKKHQWVPFLGYWCMECGHMFWSRISVMIRARSFKVPSYCPLCLHDW